jgi:CDGSH-type Zn-finger protein/truncated hemoglobin YjbI
VSEQTTAGRGALAQVLATRGGTAAAEAPFIIEHREALIYMLCEAAELEHAIMCQYLYAAFSLKENGDEGLTDAEVEVVKRWRHTVSHIATQEMLHLALVQNLLSAIGAAPHLSRPNLPQPAGHYPPGVILTLLPFGEAALRHFMFLERPEGMDLADAPGLAAVERSAPIMQEGEIVPRLQDFATVGHLYRSIEVGIQQLCAKYGEPWLFIGPADAQAGEDQFGWPQLVQVTDSRSAQRAIDTILEQGEGPRGDWHSAHFGLFVNILDEYQQLKAANPAFEPARPVLPATVRPSERDVDAHLIGDPFTARCTDLFNVSYEILLQALTRYFAHTDETGSQLAVLAQLTLDLMFTVIKPLGQLVTTLPVDTGASNRTAGPSFELFYESDYLLPHRDAAWALIEERLREAAAFADRLGAGGRPEIAGRLQPIGPALLQLAHNLASCRAEWGGPSHASEVTVAHRRRDALQARADPAVTETVESLATALRQALLREQSLALRSLLAAGAMGRASSPERDQTQRARKRAGQMEADRHFERLVDLADLLVAVIGATTIDPPSGPDSPVADGSSDIYSEITSRLCAVPPEALLVDPHPSPTFRREERRRSLPGVVDQPSALDLIAQLTQQDAPAETEPPSAVSVLPGLPTEPVAQLFGDAYEALLAVLGQSVCDEPDVVAARHRWRDLAAGLWARVLRPLAEAGGQLGIARGAPGGEQKGAGRVAELLRALALSATTARATAAAAPAGLLEAAAGLQNLALTYAAATEQERARLLDQFREAESEVPRSIQLSANGPYLLSNVDGLTNHLGDALPTRPQMALCRCGQSAAKPWCDGSHARVDFADGKDPNRVADRRDTYRGVSITVHDNRGICQHSGYCTDRIPLAFRVDREPFVAPSGARLDEIIRAVRNCPSGALSYAIDDDEARHQVDWHNQRPPAVTVTKDGPYRVTGALPLVAPTGGPVDRNQGSSLEHYALCRCGHSQNKPFCSGMHWYIDFRDPLPDPARQPTLYEWCGGRPALARMTRLFFERYVAEDPLLAPLFADVSADHPERLAAWLGEVLGGPPRSGAQHDDDVHLVTAANGETFSEAHRARWVSLMYGSAQQTGLPTDPEFWSAFTALIEWVSRQAAGPAPTTPPAAGLPIRRWDWTPAGPPPLPPDVSPEPTPVPPAAPGPDEPVSFADHIQPLFRQRDRQAMAFAFDLSSYDAVKEHAQAILDRLRAGTMPCDGPWPQAQIELYQRWIDGAMAP